MFFQVRPEVSSAARLHFRVFLVAHHEVIGRESQHDVDLLDVREKLFVRQAFRRNSRRLQLQDPLGR